MNLRGLVIALLVTGRLLAAPPADAAPIRLISAPALSPDGRRMVFEWTGDLWLASSAGGEAKRLTHHEAREVFPRFSPDGTRIVFSSDRTGSLQIHSLPVTGGEMIRHTHHTEGNELECLSPDGKRAIVRGIRERSGHLATRLMEIDLTNDRREMRLFDATAHSASIAPDGTRILFCRGGEPLYRKGFKGSRASQIWLYHIKDRSFECKIAGDTEARSPLWLPDGTGFYYTDNRSGAANLWLRRDGQAPRQLTFYQDDGVITPDLSADGSTIVFRSETGVFRYHPGADQEPAPLELWTQETLPDVASLAMKVSGTASADFTGDLKQVVFEAAGDLWRNDASGGPPVQLTHTPAAETDLRFSPDGKWLYFLRDDGLEPNYYRALFADGKLLNESPVTRGTLSKSRLRISPDGSAIAWVQGNGDLHTAGMDGSHPKAVYKCWDMPTYDWSPDGNWLAVAAEDRQSNRDIWLVAADGQPTPVNLTHHPAYEGSPKWSPDGRWLVFSAKRDNSRKSMLWRIDFGKSGPQPEMAEVLAEMIPTKGISPIRVLWAADSKTVRFQSSSASSKKLYSIGIDGKDMRVIANQRGIPIRMGSDGALLWRVGRTAEILTSSGPLRFPFAMEVQRPREEVLRIGFRRIWRILGERYYDPEMNGRDWQAMRRKYEASAVAARDSRQFDRVISFLRGELNASHLAFLRKPWPGETRKQASEEKTAHPGVVFRDGGPADGPLEIKRVIAGSPVAMLENPPTVGDSIVRIAGEPVSNATPMHRFFNGAEDRALPVVLRDGQGRERVIELRCLSYAKARSLDIREREELAMRRVDGKKSGIRYLRVPNMNRETLEKLEVSIYQASLASSGVILDLRNNTGGREADRLLNLFCQPVHSFTIPREGPKGYPIDRRPAPFWEGPLVVVCNQNTFSNAEIFCHAVKHLRRAPLVGIATAGGVISAIHTTIPDVGELQVPFRGWYHAESGKNLDLNGAEPDHRLDLTPADEDADKDPQLEKAIKVIVAASL